MRLAALTTYFNPCHYRRPRTSYDRFAVGIAATGIPLWTIELAFDDDDFELPADRRVFRVRGTRSHNLMWQKERLLNLLIAKVGASFDALAWLDCDVLFLNSGWPAAAIEALRKWPVVQVFADAYHLMPSGQLDRIRHGVGWACQNDEARALNLARYHPGFAWAARTELLARHGLLDHDIIGGGDSLMFRGFTGRELWMTSQINAQWRTRVEQWAGPVTAATGGAIGSVPGSILHLWHGSRDNRRYLERWQYLTTHGFDPATDIRIDANGLWSWTESALAEKWEMVELVRGYFAERREDD